MSTDGLSISQWLPCPLAIWAFGLDGKSCLILLNLKSLNLLVSVASVRYFFITKVRFSAENEQKINQHCY